MKYEKLTKYINVFSGSYSAGKWVVGDEGGDKNSRPVRIPFLKYDGKVFDFLRDMRGFMDRECVETLDLGGIDIERQAKENIDVTNANDKEVLALITYVINEEHFSDGEIKSVVESGTMSRWLKRLEEIDSVEAV